MVTTSKKAYLGTHNGRVCKITNLTHSKIRFRMVRIIRMVWNLWKNRQEEIRLVRDIKMIKHDYKNVKSITFLNLIQFIKIVKTLYGDSEDTNNMSFHNRFSFFT